MCNIKTHKDWNVCRIIEKLALLIINPKHMQILIKETNSPLVPIEGSQEADARWDWCHPCVYVCV